MNKKAINRREDVFKWLYLAGVREGVLAAEFTEFYRATKELKILKRYPEAYILRQLSLLRQYILREPAEFKKYKSIETLLQNGKQDVELMREYGVDVQKGFAATKSPAKFLVWIQQKITGVWPGAIKSLHFYSCEDESHDMTFNFLFDFGITSPKDLTYFTSEMQTIDYPFNLIIPVGGVNALALHDLWKDDNTFYFIAASCIFEVEPGSKFELDVSDTPPIDWEACAVLSEDDILTGHEELSEIAVEKAKAITQVPAVTSDKIADEVKSDTEQTMSSESVSVVEDKEPERPAVLEDTSKVCPEAPETLGVLQPGQPLDGLEPGVYSQPDGGLVLVEKQASTPSTEPKPEEKVETKSEEPESEKSDPLVGMAVEMENTKEGEFEELPDYDSYEDTCRHIKPLPSLVPPRPGKFATHGPMCKVPQGSTVDSLLKRWLTRRSHVQVFVDCDNVSYPHMIAVLDTMESWSNVDTIHLFIDDKATHAWHTLDWYEKVVMHRVERIKSEKSIADVQIATYITQQVYEANCKDIVLMSSDSDFAGLLGTLRNVSIAVGYDFARMSGSYKKWLAEHKFPFFNTAEFFCRGKVGTANMDSITRRLLLRECFATPMDRWQKSQIAARVIISLNGTIQNKTAEINAKSKIMSMYENIQMSRTKQGVITLTCGANAMSYAEPEK